MAEEKKQMVYREEWSKVSPIDFYQRLVESNVPSFIIDRIKTLSAARDEKSDEEMRQIYNGWIMPFDITVAEFDKMRFPELDARKADNYVTMTVLASLDYDYESGLYKVNERNVRPILRQVDLHSNKDLALVSDEYRDQIVEQLERYGRTVGLFPFKEWYVEGGKRQMRETPKIAEIIHGQLYIKKPRVTQKKKVDGVEITETMKRQMANNMPFTLVPGKAPFIESIRKNNFAPIDDPVLLEDLKNGNVVGLTRIEAQSKAESKSEEKAAAKVKAEEPEVKKAEKKVRQHRLG